VELLVRWTHVICGIAWIGASFYFIALDASLIPGPQLPAGVKGDAWQVHGGGFYQIQKYLVAPAQMPKHLTWFKWEAYATWIFGFALLVLGGFAGAGGLCGGVLEEAAVLLELSGESGELGLGLGEIVLTGGDAGGELDDAVGVGGGAGGDALEFDGGLVGELSGFANLRIERVALLHAGGVLGVHGFDVGGLGVDLGGEEGDLLGGGGLLGIKLGHAAGEDDAEAGAQFVAECAVALGLGGLTLEGGHLAGDFVEDIVDAGEIEAGGFEA